MKFRMLFPLCLFAAVLVGLAKFGESQAQSLFPRDVPEKFVAANTVNSVDSIAAAPISAWPFLIGHEDNIEMVEPAVAYNSIWDEFLVVWMNDRPGNDDIYAQYVSPSGMLVGGSRAYAAGQDAERRYPDVAYNPNFNEYLIVWEHEDHMTGYFSIRGQRIDLNGDKVGSEFVINQTGGALDNGFLPKVAHSFTSGKYLVVWENYTVGNLRTDIKGQLVNNDGSLDGSTFDIATGAGVYSHYDPDLAYNRRTNEFLVTWERTDTNVQITDILARVVRPDQTMPAEFAIAYYTASTSNPAVAAIPTASANGRYLVVFELEYAPGDYDIMGRVVYGDGNLSPNNFYIADSSQSETKPAVAGSETGNQFLVNWTQPTAPPIVVNHIAGRNVSADGDLLNDPQIFGGLGADNAAVAASGEFSDFLTVLDDVSLLATGRDVFGSLWGNRVYLPLLRK